jgi:hypothetical protein
MCRVHASRKSQPCARHTSWAKMVTSANMCWEQMFPSRQNRTTDYRAKGYKDAAQNRLSHSCR